ncbi:bifunctional tetrahydrofolate synthase/dihydrofolate synthase [Orbaceae bacterium ESL0727]|nr:bifunctional tetrahydrofolate synthase/dihydrofolate synthase [Orbaceae bacterium ESL0727]
MQKTRVQPHNIPNAMSDLNRWLCYLERIHPTTIELGLARVKKVAERMDLLQPAPYVFTVAGTNGKGTTCRTIEMILLAAGYRVGVYSSPHLLRFTERVRINNCESTELATVKSFDAIEQQRGDISLTYFEYGTLSALYQFKQANLDVVILEVGLGGRLDATNIVDENIAVITTIGIDHIEYLGNTRESIGREKAGIFKPNCIAVVGEPDIPDTILATAKAVNCPLYAVNRDWSYHVCAGAIATPNETAQQWDFTAANKTYYHLPMPHLPIGNAATALAALTYSSLTISQMAIVAGLQQASLPGRLQQIGENPLVILDVAHNPHAATYLSNQLARLKKEQKLKTSRIGLVRIVIGMLKDKDIKSTLSILHSDMWYCASLYGERGCDAQVLVDILLDQGVTQVQQFTDVPAALAKAKLDAQPDDIIVVCGSFHTVSAVLGN